MIELLGFYLAALLMIPAVMLVLGCRSLLRIALTAVLTVGFIYLIFDILLSTKLPQSMFLG
ncbi:MAG: tripartite tricarboxylate transporter TctB family protein [Acidaminococcaceae bacterium]|nr:tripartite tricarboxylate transporter TctB family protein [Acidaminococcaceae bacterium]